MSAGVARLELQGTLEVPVGVVEILLQAAHVSQEVEDHLLAIAVDPRSGPVDRGLDEALFGPVELTELVEAETDRELGQCSDLRPEALGGDAQGPRVGAENGLVVQGVGASELLGPGQAPVGDEELGMSTGAPFSVSRVP